MIIVHWYYNLLSMYNMERINLKTIYSRGFLDCQIHAFILHAYLMCVCVLDGGAAGEGPCYTDFGKGAGCTSGSNSAPTAAERGG